MIPIAAKDRFFQVLQDEGLAQVPSSFRTIGFLDEVPLYSRYQQIEFLKNYGDVNELLLQLSLEYLGRVKAELNGVRSQKFIAITVIRDDPADYLVPYVFVCNGRARTRLKRLRLVPPLPGLGRYVKQLLIPHDYRNYSVMDDHKTVPGEVRVFVSYKKAPEGFIALRQLATAPAP